MFGTNTPPPGWSIKSGRLEEIPTVTGYAQRGCTVRGRCYGRDCRRNVYLDWLEMTKHGQALLHVREVRETYRCGKIGGCAIQWIEEPALRVTLGDLAGRDHVAVEVRCGGPCASVHVTPVEAMIGRLAAAKAGSRETRLADVAEAIPGACAKCKLKRWRVEILWYDPATRKIPSWKTDLARRLEEARFRRALEPLKEGPPA